MEEFVINAFDLFGTIIFAITGAVRGVRHRLDMLGVIVLACVVGVGGGIIRDTIIGATPVTAFTKESYLLVCIITGMAVFFTPPSAINRNIITVCDAIGLGVFTAIGAAKGVQYHLTPIGIVLSGVFTAVGGGVLRDIMVGMVPVVLKSDFYATASLIGGVVYCVLVSLGIPVFFTFIIVSLLVIVLRLLGYRYKLQLPVAELSEQDKEE